MEREEPASDIGAYKHLFAFITESLILTKEEKKNLMKKYFEKWEGKCNEK